MPEPKIAEIGLLPAEHQEEIVLAEYEAYARNALVQLRRVREGTTIEEDHMRNRQMIVHWLMANTRRDRRRAVATARLLRGASTSRRSAKAPAGCSPKSSASSPKATTTRARALFETYGIHFDPALRDEIVARVDG